MSKRKQDKGRQPAWISVYRHTWKSDAWKVLSVGARGLYVELAANYNTKMQSSVFMSARTGSERLNVHKDCITKWLRELEHYGFIVKVSGPFLGSDGEAKSAHYRLTDRWYAGKEPTHNFQNRAGELFDPKKQNPVLKNRTPRPKKPDIGVEDGIGQNGNKRPKKPDIGVHADCPKKQDITSLTICSEECRPEEVPLQPALPAEPASEPALPPRPEPGFVWSAPVGSDRDELLEILVVPEPIPGKLKAIDYPEVLRRLYRCEALEAAE